MSEIAANRKHLRAYPVKAALVNNPKTPVRVAMILIGYLYKRDLVALANNRNVSAVLFNAARKRFKAKFLN